MNASNSRDVAAYRGEKGMMMSLGIDRNAELEMGVRVNALETRLKSRVWTGLPIEELEDALRPAIIAALDAGVSLLWVRAALEGHGIAGRMHAFLSREKASRATVGNPEIGRKNARRTLNARHAPTGREHPKLELVPEVECGMTHHLLAAAEKGEPIEVETTGGTWVNARVLSVLGGTVEFQTFGDFAKKEPGQVHVCRVQDVVKITKLAKD